MLKVYIDESYLFTEAIADIKKYYPNIPDDIFIQLIELDPTYREGSSSAGKYGKWLLNLYNKGNLSETEFEYIPQLLNQFTTYRNRIQNKDLNSYKSLSALEDVLASVVDDDSMLTDRQKLRFLKNVKSGKIKTSAEDDYDIVLETPKFIVYVPNTHEASMFLGKGTEWCTAHENPEWYEKYTSNGGKLYIIKNKKNGRRWQYSDSTGDFLNGNDNEFDVSKLMKRDEELPKFFAKFLGIDYFAFDGTWIYDGKEIPEDIKPIVTSITISDSVTKIGNSAFSNCKSLKSITIPDSVTAIGTDAFGNCLSLTAITIPDSVTEIVEYTFAYCESLTSITIPDSVIGIGNHAFIDCSSLTSITIPDSVIEIEADAFAYCRSLASITIPDSVIKIGADAFYNCPNLIVYTDNQYVKEYCQEDNILVKSLTNNESYIRKERNTIIKKLHINEDVFAKARMCGYAVSYRDMTKGYYYLLCFESEDDANNCEDAFYRIEDMSTDEEDFWDTFNHYRLLADVWYDEINWRRDIHRDAINGMERKVYTDRNGNSWIIINGIPFDFYL